MVTEHQNRGQLVLITAITIAFILLAIVIVFNGLLFTQTVASEDASKATTDVKVAENELERGIHGMILRSNLDPDAEWETEVDWFVSEYRHAAGATRPAVVSVPELGDASVEDATLITEGDDVLGAGVEWPVLDGSGVALGYFTLTIDPDDETSVEVDPSGDSLTIRIGGAGDCTVEPNGAQLDLVRGTVTGSVANEEACRFDLESEYNSITIENDDDDSEYGIEYQIVVEGEPNVITNSETADAVWGVSDVTYTYDSSDVTATRSFEIENIYEDVPDHLWPGGESP